MKTKAAQLIAVFCIGLLPLFLTACKGAEKPVMGSSAAPEEWIERYNSGAAGLQCVYTAQRLTSGKICAGSAVSIDLLSNDALREVTEREENWGAPLPKLSGSDVAAVRQEGTAVTFQLREVTFSEQGAGQGRGGYVNIIDSDRVTAMINGAKEYFHISNANVQLKSVIHTLSGGELTAVFDNSLTKLESVRFTGNQHAAAELSYLLTVQADLTYALQSEYR